MADSSKPPASDKERAERLAMGERHGGLVVLRGGYWDGNTLWRDHYDVLPQESTKRSGYPPGTGIYVLTDAFEDTRLGYGRARVYQWTPQ